MARVYHQAWEADDESSLHLDCPISPAACQGMKTFLNLESPTSSSISLSTDECVHADYYGASFLLLDSAPGAVDVMATKTLATIEKPMSMASSTGVRDIGIGHGARLGSSNSSATLPASVRTVTTCTSSNSSTRSQNRHSILPNARRQFRRLRARDSFTDGSDYNEEGHVGTSQHGHPNNLRHLDSYILEQAPTSPPKPQSRSTNRSNSPVRAAKAGRSSSDGRSPSPDGLPSSLALSKEEFESLPPTIQRKYFSTHERLRIIRSPDNQDVDILGQETSDSPPTTFSCGEEDTRPTLRLGFGQDELENAPHRRSNSNPLRIYAKPENRLKRHLFVSADQLTAHRPRQSVILDATEESIIRIGKRQSQFDSLSSTSTSPKPKLSKMVSFTTETTAIGSDASDMKSTTDSMFESFRWLDQDEDLDLRLCLDDYHLNLRGEDVPAQSKYRPSFRRHLSISKLPFGGRTSATLTRPSTKDATATPPLMGSPNASLPGSPVHGHARRRSRALSLITPNKQPVPDASPLIDPAAAHYQDPDARMKLRVYLGSAHKFDEAVEFGFPSIEEVQSNENPGHKRAASQEEGPATGMDKFLEDDKSSIYSDDVSSAEPESPRTPEIMEKSLPVKPIRVSQDKDASAAKVDYAQAPATSREMTLRMTLTRPDLRANEDQIYGWQKGVTGRKSQAKDEPTSPVSATREGHSKESIERQFAAMDQEDLLANDNGVMKRFWNRVRRS